MEGESFLGGGAKKLVGGGEKFIEGVENKGMSKKRSS